MRERKGASAVLIKVIAAIILNILLAYAAGRFLPKLFVISPGFSPHLVVGGVLAATNLLVVPALSVLFLPLRLCATAVAFFVVNILGLYISVEIVEALEVDGVTLAIEGGGASWLFLSFILGLFNGGLRRAFR
jgi:uncharacterized membrane protein YvlD (DUF360 family)